jgi:hypothetical protein
MESTDYERLEAYLTDRLSEADKAQLSEELRQNELLGLELDKLRMVQETARRYRTRLAVQQARAAVAGQSARSVVRPLWASASVLVAACAAFLVFLWVVPVRVSPPDALAVERGQEGTLAATEKAVFDAFYRGQQLLAEQRYAEAIPVLQQVRQAPNVRAYYRQASQWFLVIAYTETNQQNEALKYWEDIRQNPQFRYPIGLLDRWKTSIKLFL